MFRKLAQRSVDDSGFSLVEIVVAMFVLAALILALAPALIASIKMSGSNVVVGAATRQVAARMDYARLQTPNCQSLTLFANQTVADVVAGPVNAAGVGVALHTSQVLGTCPSSYPGVVSFTVTVTRADTNAVVSTAKGLIYLQGAN